MNYLIPFVGYLGAVLLLVSYTCHERALIRTQLEATLCLLVYSILRADAVFTALQVACILLITFRLWRETN